MPLYEFTCQKCGHQFEELITLAELEVEGLCCPGCGSREVARGLSTFATASSPHESAPACGLSGGCGAGGFG
jgi:putative FmdB family regulatory protein